MFLLRYLLSAVVAVAIVFAPMASSLASIAVVAVETAASTHAHEDEPQGGAAAASLGDCASMMKGAPSADDCPCCGKDNACPPEFCFAKCFQFVGIAKQARTLSSLGLALLRPAVSEPLPDWSDQLQPPPPRI